jgi:Holliday junction resolvasome RuvABC endonuclease subunit
MLLGIDPGVNNCGLTVVDTTAGFKVITTHNVRNARKFTDVEKELEKEFNTRVVKVSAIVNKVVEMLETYPAIDYVAIEAPFYNHLTPQAYGSLLEVISAIKYNILVPRKLQFRMLEPMLVKKLFAGKGMAKKEVIKQFLISKKEAGAISMEVDIESLSEHEIDAVAITYVHHISTHQEGPQP